MNEPATLISTPEEWIERWNDLTSERKLEVAARMMKNADEADRCWMSDHDGQIEMWKQRATSAEGTCEKWWTERFAAGMEAMRPDMEAAERRAAEMEAQVRELTLWRDAVLTRSEP